MSGWHWVDTLEGNGLGQSEAGTMRLGEVVMISLIAPDEVTLVLAGDYCPRPPLIPLPPCFPSTRFRSLPRDRKTEIEEGYAVKS